MKRVRSAVMIVAVTTGVVAAVALRGAETMTTPAIPGVVAAGTPVQEIKTWEAVHGGEGPLPTPDGELLFVTDEPFRINKIDKHDVITTYLDTQPKRILGLAYDHKGRLIGTQRGPSAIVLLKPSQSLITNTFEGKTFESPNDLVVDSKNGIYFTDPVARAEPGRPAPEANGTRVSAVYYLKPDGTTVLRVTDAPPRPNGITMSPDGKTVYVASGPSPYVMALDVQPDGTLKNPHDFAQVAKIGEESGADGIAVDNAGRLYVAAPAGIHVFSPKGEPLGVITLPLRPRNMAFSGPNKKTLYVICRGGAYKIAALAEGPKGRAK